MSEQGQLVGEWGVCSVGRVGYIEGQEELPWGLSWVGVGLDGKPWASRNPFILPADVAANIREHYQRAFSP